MWERARERVGRVSGRVLPELYSALRVGVFRRCGGALRGRSQRAESGAKVEGIDVVIHDWCTTRGMGPHAPQEPRREHPGADAIGVVRCRMHRFAFSALSSVLSGFKPAVGVLWLRGQVSLGALCAGGPVIFPPRAGQRTA